MKKCNDCLVDMELTSFYKNSKSKDGFSHYCKKCYNERNKKSYKSNIEKRRAYNRKLYENNKERYKANYKKYRSKESSKSVHNARQTRRRCSKLNATPTWADLEKIKVLYEKAKWLESLTGLKYHVDHVIPLQNENVCGLHCWHNLQIIERSCNLSKGNNFEL